MVRIAQTPRNHQPAPTADAIRSGPWRPYGVSTPQRSCEPCGRRACAVTLLRPGTRHPPRVDSCFNFNNVRIGPFTTQPHALHLLANLVHVQSEPQLLRSDGNCHTQSLLGARVATSRSTRNAAVGPRTSRIFRVVTQPTFGMGLSALSASVSARQALGIGHDRATIESRAGGTETQSPRRMCTRAIARAGIPGCRRILRRPG